MLGLFTTDPFDLGFKIMGCLDLSLIFSIVRSAWSIDYNLVLPLLAMSLTLSSR